MKNLSPTSMLCLVAVLARTSQSRANRGGAAWSCRTCGHTYNPLEAHFTTRDRCPHCGSSDIEKTRSSLLVEWLRFLREKKPRFAIYENVKNIVGSRFKNTFDLFIKELEDYGYNVYWQVLNAKNYGIPQNRERVYCVIIRKDLDIEVKSTYNYCKLQKSYTHSLKNDQKIHNLPFQ